MAAAIGRKNATRDRNVGIRPFNGAKESQSCYNICLPNRIRELRFFIPLFKKRFVIARPRSDIH